MSHERHGHNEWTDEAVAIMLLFGVFILTWKLICWVLSPLIGKGDYV